LCVELVGKENEKLGSSRTWQRKRWQKLMRTPDTVAF
jgi:hypothetical protein